MTKLKQINTFVGAALLALLSTVAPVANAAYIFTDLSTIGGFGQSSAAAINNAGQVAGTAAIGASSWPNATRWDGATATNVGLFPGLTRDYGSSAYAINTAGQVAGVLVIPGYCPCLFPKILDGVNSIALETYAQEGSATAINSSGQVAGWTTTVSYYSSAYHATVWDGPTTTILASLGGSNSFATGINDSGVVVGNSDTGGDVNRTHAAVWHGTTATDLGTLGGSRSEARAINGSGQIAGYGYLTGDTGVHATIWNGTTISDLGSAGIDSWANALNADGVAVGASYAYALNNGQRATMWDGLTATDLNTLLDEDVINAGWVLTSANGINDNGWIVGDAVNSISGARHGFLLSTDQTVPEPSTMALIALALVGLGLTRREQGSKRS